MGWDATTYDERFGFVTGYGATLLDLLAARPGERVLDLGCGTGHQAAALAQQGCRVVGLDADDRMLAKARADHAGVRGLEFVAGDAQELDVAALIGPEGEHPFDAVLSNAALHWMPRTDAVLRGVAAVLRPEGRFVAELGGAGNIARTTAAIEAALVDLGVDVAHASAAVRSGLAYPTPAEQTARLEAAGFVVRRLEYFDRPTPLADGDSAASWSRVFRPDARTLVGPDRQDRLDARIDAHAVAAGLRRDDGGWLLDYVRLRFVAQRGAGPQTR